MALEKNERTNVYIAFNRHGLAGRQYVISRRGMTLEQHAQMLANQGGYENVRVVTEIERWRGKNGKRSYELVSEMPVGE